MYNFKINRIMTNDKTIIEPKRINIIVGPNSSGKSRFLKDLKNSFGSGIYGQDQNNIVIKYIEFTVPESAFDFIEKYDIENRIKIVNSNAYIRNYFGVNINYLDPNSSIGNYLENMDINLSLDWKREIENDIKNLKGKFSPTNDFLLEIPENAENINVLNKTVISYDLKDTHHEQELGSTGYTYAKEEKERLKDFALKYGRLFYQYLGTEEKLFLCKRQRRYGIEGNNTNLLSELQLHLEDAKKLSNITKELFGKYIYLDRFSYGDSLAFRVSEDFNFYEKIRQDDSKSEALLSKYPLLDEEGDGIKNFVSTYLAIKSTNKDLIMIDEPESFLHPPLARRFGEILSREIKENQQLFLVTHSEDVINGIVSTTPRTQFNIIRIEREKNINKTYVMPEKDRRALKSRPIMLMSNIVKGFFSEKVYVTESFADSALYQNLMIKIDNYSSFYFVNTEGKDKIGPILELYDNIGVKSIGIYDFDYIRKPDILKDSLGKRMGSGQDYQAIFDTLKEARNYIEEKVKNEVLLNHNNLSKEELKKKISSKKDEYYHEEGLKCIKDMEIRKRLNQAINEIKRYGIYILKTGCLETTLKKIGISFSKNKSSWIDTVLSEIEKMDEKELKKIEIIDLISGKV